MKFRACVSENGKNLLEKNVLPCLEKHGKSCHMLLSPGDAFLIQTTEDADGMQISARCSNAELFCEGFKIESKHKDLIAFTFELSHLRGALRAASSSEADTIDIKLTMKRQPAVEGASQPPAKPILCLSSRGVTSNMTHEIPIVQITNGSEIDELFELRESGQLCKYYVDIQGEQSRLQALVDKLKSIDNVMTVVTTLQGFLYLQVSAPGIRLASEVQNLQVVPVEIKSARDMTQYSSPEGRLQEAMRQEEGDLVVLQQKHFARSLHSSQVVQPLKLLLGIANEGAYVHFVFVFPPISEESEHNENIALSYTVPVRDLD